MKPNDETIYNGMNVENGENSQVEDNKKKSKWKTIGLGGATGILMGAGAISAAEVVVANTDEGVATGGIDSGADVKVSSVNPESSFSEAFEEARAEVGPGGVFHWRGGIYNTYTEEEWNSMTDEQKQEFAERVSPEFDVDKIDTDHINAEHPQVHLAADVHTDDIDDISITPLGDENIVVDGENVAQVSHFDVEGHHGVVVDFTDEDAHDIAIVDLNDNNEIDDGEAVDLHTGKILDSNLNPIDNQGDNHFASLDESDDDIVITPLGDEDIVVDGENVAQVSHFEIDGHQGAVVDFADDDVHDIGIVDLNDNQALDDGEAIDLTTGDILDANLNPMDPMNLTTDSSDMNDLCVDSTFDA